jgi:phosphoglycolate phosphatase
MRLILFDLDGTLIDSQKIFVNSILAALSRLGISNVFFESDIAKLFGKSLFNVIESLGVEHETESVVKLYREEFFHRKHSLALFPGVLDILDFLRGEKFIMTLVTNRSTDLALEIADEVEISEYFSHILGTDEYKPKPNPDMLIAAMKLNSANQTNTIFVGDSEADYIASQACGVKFVRFINSKGQWDDALSLESSGTKAVISNWNELRSIVINFAALLEESPVAERSEK